MEVKKRLVSDIAKDLFRNGDVSNMEEHGVLEIVGEHAASSLVKSGGM